MDLALYARVLWRFRMLVLAGLLAAILLAILSYAHISLEGGRPKLSPRGAEQWQSESTIFVTQEGFPWGRTVLEYTPADPDKGLPALALGDQGRLSSLAILYAQLANSDVVYEAAARSGPVPATVQAMPVTNPSNGEILPLVSIRAVASSPEAAKTSAQRVSDAFRTYFRREQAAAGISPDERVILEVVKSADQAQLVAGRKKTLPIIVFLAVATATIGSAFLLENLRPRTAAARRRKETGDPAATDALTIHPH